MKALIRYHSNPGSLRIEDIPVPELKPGQVQIKVSFVGICGRDLEHNSEPMPAEKIPYLPGHEFSGIISKVSDEFKNNFKVGDRVTAETVEWVCELCPECKAGNYNLCKKRKNIGGGMSGAFAEFINVPGRFVHKLPDSLTMEEAATIEPCAVSYNATIKNSNIKKDDHVVIIGAGTIGLLCLQFSKYLGAKTIVVGHSSDTKRLELAKKLGADNILYSDGTCAAEIYKWATDGVDTVIDTVGGVDATMNLAIEIVKPLGQITKVGWFMKSQNINWDKLVRKCIKLQGSFSHNYNIWEEVIKLINDKKINAKEIISATMPLEAYGDAFESLYSKQSVKILLQPSARG